MSEPIQSISQNNYILATQQEVSHDNSLSGNGTVDSPLGVVPGYNETVLWEGTHNSFNTPINLSEAVSNFERISILFGNAENKYMLWQDVEIMSASDGYYFDVIKGAGTSNFWIQGLYCSGNDTQIVPVSGKRMNFGSFTASTNITSIPVNTSYPDSLMFRKIIGINRIANN